jgi:DNA polymerase-4
MARCIFHIDLDAFFVSVEQALNPELKGKPVIVGGDPERRGVVASASYEARPFDIHADMPLPKKKSIVFVRCPRHTIPSRSHKTLSCYYLTKIGIYTGICLYRDPLFN